MHNTAKLLCAKIGFCGVWTCSEDDFMCARYEVLLFYLFMYLPPVVPYC
jgi:hypothetical protein